MKVSIIIPTYNEAKTILEVIESVKQQKVSGVTKEIIVVDDASTDNSYELLKKVKGITLIRHPKNRGKGAAIRNALKKVTGDIVLIQDADLELTPKEYPALLKPLLMGKADVVYGSREINPDRKQKHNSIHYLGGRIITLAANIIYGIHITDEPNGFKLFRTNIIKDLNLKCERYEFCPEATAKVAKRKIKIYEVPVRYYPRTIKQGKKVKFKDAVEAIWTLIKYRFSD